MALLGGRLGSALRWDGFRGLLGATMLGVVLMLHHGNSEGLGSHQDFGGWATSGFEDFVVP